MQSMAPIRCTGCVPVSPYAYYSVSAMRMVVMLCCCSSDDQKKGPYRLFLSSVFNPHLMRGVGWSSVRCHYKMLVDS